MFKKFHWGHGIAVFFIFFVGTLITVLIKSFGVDHSLVVDDYYAKDITYQKRYDKEKNNLRSNSLKIKSDKTAQSLTFDFTTETTVKGVISFYRPSDKSKDFTVPVDKSKMEFNTSSLVPGKWVLKIDWEENGKQFYKEETIYI